MGEPQRRTRGRPLAPAVLDRRLCEDVRLMSEHDELIDRLADLVGIARGYTDYFGNPVASPIEARRAILADFGLPTGTEALARESLARAEELRHGLVPRLIPVEAG